LLLASAIAIPGSNPRPPNAATNPPRIVRLWRDTVRVEQLARLQALELQAGDEFGQRAWDLAHEQWRNLPDHARVDLPSPRAFGRVLGLFRTGACLKTGKLLRLEISAQEIADLLGYSKSTVEAVLRWVGAEAIEYQGDQLSRGLSIIHRGRRTAWAFLEGKMRRVYRTSRLVLTNLGRLMLGLPSPDDHHRQQKRQAYAHRKAAITRPAPSAEPTRRAELDHVQGIGSGGGGHSPVVEGTTPDVGREWLRKIQSSL